eukprot:3819495-Prorocentrum_lima.AAC.1
MTSYICLVEAPMTSFDKCVMDDGAGNRTQWVRSMGIDDLLDCAPGLGGADCVAAARPMSTM